MRWLGAALIAAGACQTWKALHVAAQYGFHSWLMVVEQNKGRVYEVPLFETLIAGIVLLLVGTLVFVWGPDDPKKGGVSANAPAPSADRPRLQLARGNHARNRRKDNA
jgi:hypothetical protein